MSSILLVMGTLLTSLSALPYIRDILRKKVRPRIVTWLVWTVLLGLMSAAGFRSGQTATAILAAVSAVQCAVIVGLGLRGSNVSLSKVDIVCLIGSVIGIFIWAVLDNPEATIIVAVVVDIIAFIPTLIHGWEDPEEESLGTFGITAVGAGFVLASAAIAHASMIGLLYPLYSVTFSTLMVGILILGRTRAAVDYEYDTN